jgi:REP element-mobilizing transposase RayT
MSEALDNLPIQVLRSDRQQLLPLKEKKKHGGARPGAGRKPSGLRAGVPHRRRERHHARHPVHVTLRAREGLPSLRGDRLLLEAMRSSIALSERPTFRVVHFSIQSNHLHLIVEADDELALSRFTARLELVEPSLRIATMRTSWKLLARLAQRCSTFFRTGPSTVAVGTTIHALRPSGSTAGRMPRRQSKRSPSSPGRGPGS